MPWELKPPRQGKSTNFTVRGTYLGIKIDRSTGTGDRRAAARILATWRRQAERGEFERPHHQQPEEPTFVDAAITYMRLGGQGRFLPPIIKAWRDMKLAAIDQLAIDALAVRLYPEASAATRNRQVYTPVLAVLRRAKVRHDIERPIGHAGEPRTFWLQPEPTFRLLAAAEAADPEFGIFCTLLNYTGMRLSEGLNLTCENIDLARQFAFVPTTKTGEPRGVFLPSIVIKALGRHPRGLDREGRVFSHDKTWMVKKLREACKAAGITLPHRTAFHVFRHNYATWMRLHAGLDALGLTRTGAWSDMDSVKRYAHSEASAEARQAERLPTPPKRGQRVERKRGAA